MHRSGLFYGWVLVGVLLVLQMVGIGTINYSYSLIVLPFQTEFNASRMAMMLGITIMPLASAIMSPFLGRAIDRHSLRFFVLIAAVLLPLGFLLLSMITAMWQVPLIYGVCMAYATLMLGPLGSSTLLSRWFQQRLAFALGIAAIGTSIGGFVFPPLLSWLTEHYGWRDALRIMAAVIAAMTVPAAALIVNRPSDRGLNAFGATDGDDVALASNEPPHVLGDRNFWLVAGTLGSLFATYGAILANLGPFAVESGISRDHAALLIALVAVAGIIGKIGFGFVSDRIDLRIGLGTAVALVIMGLSCFIAGGSTLVVVGCASIGLAAGGMLPVWGAMLAWLFGVEHYGRVMGMMNLSIVPLSVLGPLVTGILRDASGDYRSAFMLFLGLLTVGLLLVCGVRNPVARSGVASTSMST